MIMMFIIYILDEFWASARQRGKGKREHLEGFGIIKAQFTIRTKEKKKPDIVEWREMGTFRDHSWDIRDWAYIERLFILLLTFPKDKPLVVNGKRFWHLDVTVVRMPKNGNLKNFMCGWIGNEDEIVPFSYFTAMEDIESDTLPCPPKETNVVAVLPDGSKLEIKCFGKVHRLMYWPQQKFIVFEDAMQFKINGYEARGIRQFGYDSDFFNRMKAKHGYTDEDLAKARIASGIASPPDPYEKK